jgi:hypothetical protein
MVIGSEDERRERERERERARRREDGASDREFFLVQELAKKGNSDKSIILPG